MLRVLAALRGVGLLRSVQVCKDMRHPGSSHGAPFTAAVFTPSVTRDGGETEGTGDPTEKRQHRKNGLSRGSQLFPMAGEHLTGRETAYRSLNVSLLNIKDTQERGDEDRAREQEEGLSAEETDLDWLLFCSTGTPTYTRKTRQYDPKIT
ncbi:hypothetical protein EYF80_031823 [Liparis tanakae]|uniref:Uncharacterized protein n=1 Tax=Liparis tanakae TaxID=230148 RepID=A0A4Z2GX29_9TELE|nr:hypothetical protein EYF80_031823 [Liparis tanakae]